MKIFLKNTFKRVFDGISSLLFIIILLSGIKLGYASIVNDFDHSDSNENINEINSKLKDTSYLNEALLNKKIESAEKLENGRIKFKENISETKEKEILNKFKTMEEKEKKMHEKILQNHFSKKTEDEDNNYKVGIQNLSMNNEQNLTMEDLGEINSQIEEEFNKLINENFTKEERQYISEITPNYLYSLLSYLPNDSSISGQWYIKKVTERSDFQIPDSNSPEVIVAIIDSGIDTSHDDLKGKLWTSSSCVNHDGNPISGGCLNGGWDYADSDANPDCSDYATGSPSTMHSTMVGGILGASTNNNKGMASFSNNKAKIMSIRVFKYYTILDSTTGQYKQVFTAEGANIAKGIYFAVRNGAKIINMSLGGPVYDSTTVSAINYAKSRGVLVVAAAGNGDKSGVGINIDTNPIYPAAYNIDNIIAVAALDEYDKLTYFSNYGQKVHIAAPGINMATTAPRNSYVKMGVSGTSFSAPLVASVAIQLYQTGDTYQTLKNKVLNSAGTFNVVDSRNISGSRSLKMTSTSSEILPLQLITTDYLTKTHYNLVVSKINEIIDRLGNVSTNSLYTLSNNCYWKTIKTNEAISCNANEYAIGLCLTNKSLGCPDGNPSGTKDALNTAGAIQCCLSY